MSIKVVVLLKPLLAFDLQVSLGVSSLVHSVENDRSAHFEEMQQPLERGCSHLIVGNAQVLVCKGLK